MAKLEGIIKFTGTIDGISFYNSKHGWLARKKGGPDPEKMKKDARFVRVRENGKEFGACGRAAGQLRRALALYLGTRRDPFLIGRLTKSFIKLKNMDTVGKRGLRSIENGLAEPGGKDVLKGFNFNESLPLTEILKLPCAVNLNTGTISLKAFQPKLHITAPKGATHVVFKAILVGVNLRNTTNDIQASQAVRVSLKSSKTNVLLNTDSLSIKSGIRLLLLQLNFEQEINNNSYTMTSQSHSVLELVDLDLVSKAKPKKEA